MPVTQLDRRAALIVIDLQEGLAASPKAHSLSDIVERTNALSAAFRRKRLPVIMVVVEGVAPGRTEQPRRTLNFPPNFTDPLPGLVRLPGDLVVRKKTSGAFANTELERYLVQNEITQVVIAGFATSSGVESTARQAYELGFNVTIAVDAMTDSVIENHDDSVKRIFPRLGETGNAEAIIALVEGLPT